MEHTFINTLMNNFVIRRLVETFAFFKTHALIISKFLLLATLPLLIIEIFLAYYRSHVSFPVTIQYLSIIIGYLYQPIYAGGLIYLIYQTVSDKKFSLRQCVFAGLACWADLVIVNIIISAIIIIGLIAFILPGIIAFARLSLAEYGVVINKLNPKQAIIQSYTLSKEFMWQIIGSSFLLSGILLLFELAMQTVIRKLSLNNLLISGLSSLISVILWSNITILLFRFYDLSTKTQNQAADQAIQQN